MTNNLFTFVALFLTIHCLCSSAKPLDDQIGSDTGAKKLGDLKAEWEACIDESLQTDLSAQMAQLSPHLGPLQTNYISSPAIVQNKGYHVMVHWKQNAGSITINGTEYYLTKMHCHSPSMHSFNGSRLPVEVHLVHSSYAGESAVVAVTYHIGHSDPIISKVLQSVKSSGEEGQDAGEINAQDIIPKTDNRAYFRYASSLTTPPCNQGVLWTIFIGTNTVSMEEVKRLKQVVDQGFQSNARPSEPIAAKTIYMYPNM